MTGTEGSLSDGLRMNAFPQATAGANFHIGIIAGKLNGVIPATTPTGWRIEYMSMPGPALSENSPFRKCGAPMQNSATSKPLWTSPLASGSVLPCSLDSLSASLSMSRCSNRTNSISTRPRRCGFVAAHFGWAASAPLTAASTSPALASGTRACTSPVAGLNTSPNRPEAPAVSRPFKKCGISLIFTSLRVVFSRLRCD